MTSKNEYRIEGRKRLLLSIALGMAALCLIGGGAFFYRDFRVGEVQRSNQHDAVVAQYRYLIKENIALMGTTLDVLCPDERLVELVRTGNAEELNAQYGEVFQGLRNREGIRYFTMLNAQGKVITRLHKPYGDVLSHPRTYLPERKRGSPETISMVLSSYGTLSLRTIRALYAAEGLVGYIELGVEMNTVLETASRLHGVDLAFAVRTDRLPTLDRPIFTARGGSRWINAENGLMVNTTLSGLDKAFVDRMLIGMPEDGTLSSGVTWKTTFHQNKQFWSVCKVAAKDVFNGKYGMLFIIEDVTEAVERYGRIALVMVLLAIFITTAIYKVVAFLLEKAERRAQDFLDEYRREERLLNNIYSETEIGTILFDETSGKAVRANNSALNILGVAKPADIHIDNIMLLHPNDPLQKLWRSLGFSFPLSTLQQGTNRRFCAINRFSVDVGVQCLTLQDVTGVILLQKESQMQMQYLQSVIDQLPGTICIKDNQCRILTYNRSFERTFGAGKPLLLRIRHPEVDEDTMNRLLAADRYALERDEAVTVEAQLLSPDGMECTLMLRKRRIVASDGTRHILSIGTDITEHILMTRQLVELRREAEEASRGKSMFLAKMSHEIRTPMNIILGMCHLALDSRPDPKQEAYLNKIRSAANNLLGIINEILDFSKAEAGEMRLASEPFSLSGLLGDIGSSIPVLLEGKPVEFLVDAPEDIPAVVGDQQRLRQVLLNLVNNAIKFTHVGHIRLLCRKENETPDSLTLYFEVEDTGIGIAQEAVSSIFSSYGQAHSPAASYGGTGLGLPISRQFVALMGGTLSVASEFGKGTRFFFTATFPLADEETLAAASSSAIDAEDRAPLCGTLLIVEDNPLNQEIIAGMLQKENLAITLADNGLEAVKHVNDQAFDLIFMDVKMPVLDGIGATEQIRALPVAWASTVPIIALTAGAMAEDRERCLRAGMNGFVSKPIDVRELYTTLAHYLEQGKEPIPLSASAADTARAGGS